MNPSAPRSRSAASPQPKDLIDDGGDHGPMSRQDADHCHGHEMHPQQLVQLVGCHDPNVGKHEEESRIVGASSSLRD